MKTVTVRELELGDGIPKICVPVIAHTFSELERSLKTLEKSCFDLVEFRADFYFEEEQNALAAIRKAAGSRPVLYTIRTAEEGGEIRISDEEYRERNLKAAMTADLVDLQLGRLYTRSGSRLVHSNLVRCLHEKGLKVVLSWHDFDRTPGKDILLQKARAMQKEGCDIAKIAVMPGSRRDVMELLEASVEMLAGALECPFITMSMGNLGKVTRVSGALTGSCITFGTAGAMSAPGQIPSDTLRMLLDSLTAE